MKRGTLLFLLLTLVLTAPAQAQPIVIGAKKFPESNVLAEIEKRSLEAQGFQVERKEDLGNTAIVWAALKGRGISVYTEYTGTITEEILKSGPLSLEQMRTALEKQGIGMTGELGFNNGYALVMRKAKAGQLGIHNISDLRAHPDLKVAVSHEFLGRKDGWQPLAAKYSLNMQNVRGIEHTLGYAALRDDQIDVTDAYTTDAEIGEYSLMALEDDRNYFPKYRAVILYRLDIPPKAVEALRKLEGKIDETKMIAMNVKAKQTKDYAQAASLYFVGASEVKSSEGRSGNRTASAAADMLNLTAKHLWLVGISLFFAILLGVPLGIVAGKPGTLSQTILGAAGIIQTIPSLALLALLVPISFFGIGTQTAIFALFLYSLLPIIRNTATGLNDIPLSIRESAAALGLTSQERLIKVFLPMASRTILAGIKTSAIINVGTATIAALIGVECLGTPIITGLSLSDNNRILQGAIPAAVLALLVQFAFDLLDRLIIPKGLRLPPGQD